MQDEHLADVLNRRPPGRVGNSDWDLPSDSMLPDPGNGYEPYARASNHPVYSLHLVLGRDGYRSFQLVHLDSGSSFSADEQGQVIRLRFCGSKAEAVTIRGRNIARLYDLIHQHRMPWIMQVDRGRDFTKDDEPVVTSIEIEEVREPAEPR